MFPSAIPVFVLGVIYACDANIRVIRGEGIRIIPRVGHSTTERTVAAVLAAGAIPLILLDSWVAILLSALIVAVGGPIAVMAQIRFRAVRRVNGENFRREAQLAALERLEDLRHTPYVGNVNERAGYILVTLHALADLEERYVLSHQLPLSACSWWPGVAELVYLVDAHIDEEGIVEVGGQILIVSPENTFGLQPYDPEARVTDSVLHTLAQGEQVLRQLAEYESAKR